MASPVLLTKLFIPRPRPNLVSRPRLVERLNHGLQAGLVLISAPAGFGKTTLVSAWATECGCPTAWLSLDAGDNDCTRFLLHVIAALQMFAADFGREMAAALQSLQPPPVEALLTSLLNELTALPEQVVLVLDDYHLIDTRLIEQAVTFLLEHVPPQLCMIIATREDPRLPLARFRARGQLIELRAADLRFSPAEATVFLNQVMRLQLASTDIAALEDRTEGWIAGLQLAAISLQGQQDPASFIALFSGSHRFVLDYLLEEVLNRQAEHVQTFLLHTSILANLCGPLCDAVLLDPTAPGQATLEYLERANLFLVPLDNERRWYRYHHLFAELLRQQLQQATASADRDAAGSVNDLHRRASLWYADHDLEVEAFHHATAAKDVERAEHLIEGNGTPLYFRGAAAPVKDWIASLPETVLNARPSLWITYAATLMMTGQPGSVEPKLQAAEAALGCIGPDEKNRDLVGRIASMRATLAVIQHDGATISTQSRRALEHLHPENLTLRTAARWTLGFACQIQGDRATASHAYKEVIAAAGSSRDSIYTIAATLNLAQIQEADTQLSLASRTYRKAMQLAGDPPQLMASEAFLGLARIAYERNDVAAAREYGEQCLRLTRQIDSVDTFPAYAVFRSRLNLSQGDVPGAVAVLEAAEAFVQEHHFLYRLPEIAAMHVLALLQQGHIAAAAQLAQAHALPLSLARVYLAQGDPGAALAALEPWQRQAADRGWKDEQLKVLVLQVLAYHAQDNYDLAVQVLGEALALAAPGGFIRLFIDEGRPLAHLLAVVGAEGLLHAYVRRLLAAYGTASAVTVSPSPPAQLLIEPLSPREVEVLQLMAKGLSNQEMCARLFLALDTVKGHNRKIFGKLQVQRRTEAVARARELGLL